MNKKVKVINRSVSQTTGNETASGQTERRHELQQLFIKLADEKANERFSDYKLDRENQKIELLSGKTITLREVREVSELLAKQMSEYKPLFHQEFYRQINRLNGWPIPDGGIHLKPRIVGRYTKEIIYGRFPKELIAVLQTLNPYVYFGIRQHKHFQFLTEEGKKQVEHYINESIELMKQAETWHDFRVKLCAKYGVPYQLPLH